MCKNIEEMLSSIDDKSKKTWILLDTETTGLKGCEEEQLTQIAGKSCKYNLINNTFKDFNVFNKKIKLNENSIKRLKDENDKISWVLDFNGYEKGNHVYYEEKLVIGDLLTFCNTHFPCMLMAQNSDFDMDMLNGRSEYKFTQEVFDSLNLYRKI